MAKHTQAPWAIEEDHDEDIRETVLIHGAADAQGLVHVALVYTSDAFNGIDVEDAENFKEECSANAHLIAAAPDLLAVCQKIVNGIEMSEQEFAQWEQDLRAAVAKATGNTD